MKKTKTIDPERIYTITDILRDEVLAPYAQSAQSVRRIIAMDKNSKNKLKVLTSGEGVAKRYWIRGDRLITFLAHWEDGSYQL
jgi:hypothetical protein